MRTRSTRGALATILVLVLGVSACGGTGDGDGATTPTPSLPAGSVAVDLAPIPMELIAPSDLAARLTVGPMEDATYLAEAQAAGAIAVVEVLFATDDGQQVHFMNAYWFAETDFDAAWRPDEPPRFGVATVRSGGFVLGIWGPLDMPFDPASPDGEAWVALDQLTQLSASYRPTA